MEPNLTLGFLFLIIGAVCGGSFGLPSKFVKKDTPWEVLWGPFFFFVTILIPLVVAPMVVNDLGEVFSGAGTGTMVTVLIFGLLWGLGSMTLGKAFAFIGLSLAYALNYGAQIITGSVVPMAIEKPGAFLTSYGAVILAGVAVLLVGVVVCGGAAILKERGTKKEELDESQDDKTAGEAKSPMMMIGVTIGILSGVLCACWAIAAVSAGPIIKHAKALNVDNNPGFAASWAFTAVILWGGAVSACLYCVVQLTKNKTWGHLTKKGIGKTLGLAFAMAVLHDAAVFFFGLALGHLGNLGVSVGYAAFMSFAIIVGNIHGFRTGEWKGAPKQSIKWIATGIAVLVVGVSVLAGGKGMQQAAEAKMPKVFIDLSGPVDGVYDMYNTPDGMTLNKKTGIMYLAVPNFNENCFKPGCMIKIMPDNEWSKLCDMPIHPDTQRAAPMGCGMGPDGNIYVADNQFFYNINRKSRLYRVVLDDKGDVVKVKDADGKETAKVEIAADGFTLSNAVYWRGDNCYISDTFVVDDGEMVEGASCIYRITLEEMKAGTVTVTDDHIVAKLQTIKRGRNDTAGADGITFDGDGNMYCGNFGDGRIFKFAMNEDGTVKSTTCIIDDPKLMPSADGMFWDEKSNMIYIAESASNAIRRFSLDGKTIETVWENDDTTGADGMLDQPCEVIIRSTKGKDGKVTDDLISVDFDMSFPGLKNTKYDKWHGLHVIKLDPDRKKK